MVEDAFSLPLTYVSLSHHCLEAHLVTIPVDTEVVEWERSGCHVRLTCAACHRSFLGHLPVPAPHAGEVHRFLLYEWGVTAC